MPSLANAIAVAAPIPLLAPVIIATRSLLINQEYLMKGLSNRITPWLMTLRIFKLKQSSK